MSPSTFTLKYLDVMLTLYIINHIFSIRMWLKEEGNK